MGRLNNSGGNSTFTPRYPYNNPALLVEIYNQELAERGDRRGIEWALDANNRPYLRDSDAAIARRTKWIEQREEEERARFLHFQRKPYRTDEAA